jgi:hypothetical protein
MVKFFVKGREPNSANTWPLSSGGKEMLDETKISEVSEAQLSNPQEVRQWWNSLSDGMKALIDALCVQAVPPNGIILPEDWPAILSAMKPPRALVEHIVPAHSKILLHGPPGSGKSGVLWSIGNAVSEGKPFLGLKTVKANCLLISVDMNIYELKQRWGTTFSPLFPFIASQKFDLCDIEKFSHTKLFCEVQEHVERHNTELVMIDAVGGIHLGRTAIEDTTASLVDAALSYWLPNCAVLMLGHNHKQRRDAQGKPNEPSAEDCLGSQLWSANATSQLNLVKVGENVSLLRHEKCQVLPKLADPIRVYINSHGQVELYNEHKAASAVAQLQAAEVALASQLASLKPTHQAKLLADHLGIGKSKLYELRKLARETREVGNQRDEKLQRVNGQLVGELSRNDEKPRGKASA